MGCVNSLTNHHKVTRINLCALCNSSHTTQVKQGETVPWWVSVWVHSGGSFINLAKRAHRSRIGLVEEVEDPDSSQSYTFNFLHKMEVDLQDLSTQRFKNII